MFQLIERPEGLYRFNTETGELLRLYERPSSKGGPCWHSVAMGISPDQAEVLAKFGITFSPDEGVSDTAHM